MSQVGVVKILEGGVFYAKDSSGNIRELNIGDVILENEVVFGDSSNPTSAKVEMELSGNDVIVLNQAQQQLIDSSLNEVTFGNEEVIFTKNDIQNAWNNTTNDVSDDMETAAGDPTQQETQAGQEEPTEEGRVAARFNARDGNSTNVVSDLRDASWTEEQTTIIPDLEDKLIEQPLPIVFTIIDGDNIVWEGNTATYTLKVVDATGNPIIVNQDTIVYVRYTNIETDDNDTQYTHNTTIAVVVKAGTSESTFTVETKDDYLADNGERFNLEITGNNSTEFDMRTGNQTGGQTNVDTAILDNSNPTTPGGEDNGFGAEDTVFAIIEGTATVNEGDSAQYVVKLVDKDGNPVTVTKDTEVTIKYTNKTTQDGDTEYNNNDTIKITIKAGENSSDKFDVDTIDDYLADNGEKFNLEITNVDDQGQFEKVNIGDINGDKTNVDTTILDNTTDKPNENSTVESNQENVILKIVAVGEDGNPIIKDGKYTFENNVAEGSNAKYMVLAFKPGTTEFKTTDVVDTQGGTVTIKTTDDTAKTTGTKDNAELDYVSETSKTVTLGEVFEIETLDDYLKDDGEKYKVSINDKIYEHPASGAIYENVVTNTDPVTTTIKDNTTPNTETNVEDVKIVLVAVSSATITIADITNSDGTLKVTNTNETPEGGKLYYIAVAVDKDGKPLATQGGDVTINYGTTSNISDKDATAGVDYDNTTKVNTKVGVVFEVKTKDDYYAEGDENFTVKITDLKNSPYETPSIDTTKDIVTSTIKDNAPTINGTVVSGGEDTDGNTYGAEDTVYAIITGETTVNEGGVVTYTVKLVDKDGNTVIPTKETTVTVTYTNIGTTSTDDTNKTNNQEIAVKIDASGKGTFTVETKDDYYAEADENYNVKITNVQNTGEFENVKFDSYPNTIPNSPSNNVTTTIKDNPSKVEQPDTGTGNDDPINGSYGKEDTVYVKIVGNVEVVEGGDLVHNIQLIDKDGKPVIIPDGEEITVTLTYTTNHDIKDSDFVNGSNQYNETTKTITVTIDKNTPKDENGIYKLPITNKTIDDFTSEGNEVYILTITNVAQKDGKFENIAIGNPNGGEKSVTGTIKDGVTLGDPVDTTVYEDGLNNSATTENSLSNSLGITNPNNDEYKVSFDKSITTSTEKSNGQTITYSYNESGTILTAKRTDGKVVFTVELKKDASGKDVYDFQLKEAMDHEYGNNGKNDFDLSFKFSVTSNGMTSDNKTFNVTVVDSVPNAKDKTVTTNEDTATTIRLSNDAFKDNGTIKINGSDVAKGAGISIYEPSDTNKEHPIGKLLNNGDGTVKFTPSPDYSNYDFTKSPQFSYTVTDFDGDEATATVTVNVKPVADAPTIFVKNVETKEDAENIQEGTNKVALELKVPSLSKDSDAISQISPNGYTAKQKNNVTKTNPILDGTGDYNGTSTGDSPERNGEITLEFTNGLAVTGAELYNGNIKVADITANVQVVKIVIVKTSGGTDIDTDYHHNGTLPAKGENVLYLTKAEYEGLKIQHAEDNDTDIAIKISVTSYEVDDSGKPLTGNLVTSSTTTADMTVIIKPVTDDIELTFDNATVNGETLGTISPDGKTFVFKNDVIKENGEINFKQLLTNTSGTTDGTNGTEKGDLDGSEIRWYTVKFEGDSKDHPDYLIINGKTVSLSNGEYKYEFTTNENKQADPDFKVQFPNGYSGGTLKGELTLHVQDRGVEEKNGSSKWGEELKQTVNFEVAVNPVADDATVKVGQPEGYEDAGRSLGNTSNVGTDASKIDKPENGIRLPIEVTSTDKDGSETFTVTIKDIPNGSGLYVYDKSSKSYKLVEVSNDGTKITIDGVDANKSGNISVTLQQDGKFAVEIEDYQNSLKDGDGKYIIEEPKFIPPHNAHGDFNLKIDAKTVDTAIIDGNSVTSENQTVTDKVVKVVVKDVADSVVGNDYNKFDLIATDADDKVIGAHKQYNAIVSEDDNGGKIFLDSIFTDVKKLASYDSESEDLTIVIKDLPAGITLEGSVTLINDQYIFKASDIPNIKIVTPQNYSGELNFKIDYITTEAGKEANNPSKTFDSKTTTDSVSIFVKPTVDAGFNSNTTKAEDVVTVNGKSYYKLDLGISYQNSDTDESLVSVTIDKPADGDYILVIKGTDGTYTEITDFTKTYTEAELKNIYVQAPENKHGSFDIKGTYTVKDSHYGATNSNYVATKTDDFKHTLNITPVTDKPTIAVEPGTQTNIQVISGEAKTIEIPIKVTSSDKDGSENITKIVISGVPQGVTVDGLGFEELFDENGNSINVSVHNGIYIITGHNLNSINFEDIVFKINGNANFEHRDITITAYTKDAEGSTEEQTSTKITLDKTHSGTGTGEGPTIGIEIKDTNFIATEDKEFNFLDVFKVVVTDGGSDGKTELNFKIDVGSNATIKGLTPNSDGSYTITGNRADIESVLANLKIIPNKDFNSNQDIDGISIKVEANGGEITTKVPVTPVTDVGSIAIIPVDSAAEIEENGEFKFEVAFKNNVDVGTTLKDNAIYIKANENYIDSTETATGKLYYINNSDQKIELPADGKFELKDGYTIDNLPQFVYETGENKNGAVSITVSTENKEANADSYAQTSVNTTITVIPVVSSEIKVENVQDGIEDGQMASVKLTVTNPDSSEKFESVLIKVASGVAVYYDNGTKLAMNLGDGSWLVPVKSDGTLPEIFFKGKEHLGGEIDFTATINAKDGEAKVTKELTGSVTITEVADGVTIDPTKTGIDKNAFEWTTLNLNANMKDIDGSEKMHFTLEGLDSSAQFRVNNGDGTYTDLSSKASQDATGKWTIDGIEAKDINNIEISHDKSVSGAKVEAWTVDGDNVSTSDEVSGTFDLSYKADTKFDNGTFTLAKDMDIDFNNIGKLGFTNVEKIDLGAGNGKNELLNLTLDDVLSIGKKDGNGNINLTILGDGQDKVSFKDEIGKTWEKQANSVIENNKTFDVYTNSDSTVQVKVEQPISDGITN
ncbi:Ig-like domain-containing protein [Aliarcobacter butzleri]